MGLVSAPVARTRLQEDLKAGLNCVKDLWQHSVKDWITSIHAVDINQDGDTEVLAGSHSGRVYALDKDGQLRWESIIGAKVWVTAVVARPSEDSLAACVVASTRDGKIYVLDSAGQPVLPPGSGPADPQHWFDAGQPITQMWRDTFQPFTIVFTAEDFRVYHFDIANNRLNWSYAFPGGIRTLCTADVNGDGLQEVLVGAENRMLSILSSTGTLLASREMEQAVYSLYVTDIDGDRKVEMLVGTRSKKLFVLDTQLQEKWSQTLSSRPLAIAVLDMNNDNLPEVLVSCDDQSLSILDSAGKLLWRHRLTKRYHCLNLSDLDRDGHVEVLAGTDDSNVHALRIQLSKDLDRKIRRSYANLQKPDITTLTEFTNDQLNLLLSVLGTTYGAIDKDLNLAAIEERLANGAFTEALLLLLKLEQQHFQLQWEKSQMGYRRALCLADQAGDHKRNVVVSSRSGGLTIFSSTGRLLWSEKSADGMQIFDAQSGFLSGGHGEDLAFASTAGVLSIVRPGRPRTSTTLRFPEPLTCFYMLAPGKPSASDLLIGTASGKAHLYTNDLTRPARSLDLSSRVQRVYATEPDENGKYRNPHLLISTEENTLFAYTRSGNRLWTYSTRSRILALCAKDLDGDGRLEVLIGSEDRNIYVLDDNGNLRWRYVLYHTVLALDTADLNGDGKQEILAGCGDGILYVFTSIGDLIWRYASRDPIQALRAADIDQDHNFEIVMVEESHLEVLQVVQQPEIDRLKEICWQHLLLTDEPLEILLPLIKGSDPHLRAAALARMVTLDPPPGEMFELLNDAMNDAFVDVRKALPDIVMRAYPFDPATARALLNTLYTDKARDVRIEVMEHLEILARYDWSATLYYLERGLRSSERNTRRAVMRKIAQLLREFEEEIKGAQHTLGESLFKLLLAGAQDSVSIWVKQEAGRVLADFLNIFEEDFLFYLMRMFASHLEEQALQHTAYNLRTSRIQRVVVGLMELKFRLSIANADAVLTRTTHALEQVKSPVYIYSTELWLICGELARAFHLSTLDKLASYEYSLGPEHFQTTRTPYPHALLFQRVAENLTSITEPLRTFRRRLDPNDRLSSLLESINALEAFQRLVDREYGVSPLPKDLPPYQAEFAVLRVLILYWQEMFNSQRNELRGHPELQCDLKRRVHFEETVGVWLQISNHGRAPARQVKVTLLSDKSFTTDRPAQPQVVEIDSIQVNQESGAEYLIKPLTEAVTLTFEVAYLDAEHELHTLSYQERLDFIERPQKFTPIENPYTSGTPLHDSRMCYGREAPLAYLRDNLTRTSAQTVMVLYGQRRSGKTTLLNQLAKTDLLVQHVAVMVDMQSLTYGFEIGKFFFKISHWICRAMRKKDLSVPEPRQEDFVNTAGTADPLFAFELFLDQVEECLDGRLLILLLDEFEELEGLVEKKRLQPEIFEYLRSLMQARPYIHFLLSGTQQISQLTRHYWSVFFNIALHHQLSSNISPEGAIDLITRPVAGALEYEPQVVNKIRALTADQPYMIHLVCRALVDHCNKMQKNYATINDVNQVLDEVLITGTIHFDWLWDRFKSEEQLLLQAIAEGSRDEGRPLSFDDIERMYLDFNYPFDRKQIKGPLKVLWAEDVITGKSREQSNDDPSKDKSGAQLEDLSYAIANGLLRQWLKRNRALQRASPFPAPIKRSVSREDQPVLEEQKSALSEKSVAGDNQHNGSYDLSPDPLIKYAPDM